MKALLADNRDRFFATLGQDLRRDDTDSDLMDAGFCIKRGRIRPQAPAPLDEELVM